MRTDDAISLLQDQKIMKRKVRAVMRAQDDATEALASVAAAQQTVWTRDEWQKRLAELDATALTVEEWLPLNT